MGWDAYSSVKKAFINGEYTIVDKAIRRVFRKACQKVKTVAGSVDGGLMDGSLDCRKCAEMLGKATGLSCWGDDWDVDTVHVLWLTAKWNFTYDQDDAWAYHSAKMFLEICAKHSLSIRFSL